MSEPSVSFGSPDVLPPSEPAKAPRRKQTALESLALPKGKDPTECNVTHASLFPRVNIMIDESSNPSDPSRVFVSVNGRAYDIQRGVVTDVPPEVVEGLMNAVSDKVYQTPDGEVRTRPTQRFPFRIQDEEGQRVMAAWKEFHEKQRAAA